MAGEKGKLILTKRGTVQIEIGGTLFNAAQSELSTNMLNDLKALDGQEVELDRVNGQPTRIRKVGEAFAAPPAAARSAPRSAPRDGRSAKGHGPAARRHHGHPAGRSPQSHQPALQGDFHNPYNFVPAPPRKKNDPDLGDHPPEDQDAYLPDHYSGSIRVRMTVETPLLVPDTGRVEEAPNGHKSFHLRIDQDGRPVVPASGVRGMLRSAYEAVTNSRLGRFDATHQYKHKYRQSHFPFRKIDYSVSPLDLLDPSLRPAATIDELSPADRVFGWVRVEARNPPPTKGDCVAAKGQLRVGPVRFESRKTDLVEQFKTPGVPIAILAAPKPQQGRFYVAQNPNGDAQADCLDKVAAGYSARKGLRGRKVYPHHKDLPTAYWEKPTEDRTQVPSGAHHQEYRRPHKGLKESVQQGNRMIEKPKRNLDGSFTLLEGEANEQRDDQNRSILGWVKPKAEFTFELQVLNLSAVELGGLLWLLQLPGGNFFRLGGGKPLGFGSVSLKVESSDLRTAGQLRGRYAAWHVAAAMPSPDPTTNPVEKFQQAVVRAYPSPEGSFDEVPFIKSFLAACRGLSLPVHYPRATAEGRPGPPSPDGESFKWFVANERRGARHALPDLASGKPLPTLKE